MTTIYTLSVYKNYYAIVIIEIIFISNLMTISRNIKQIKIIRSRLIGRVKLHWGRNGFYISFL